MAKGKHKKIAAKIAAGLAAAAVLAGVGGLALSRQGRAFRRDYSAWKNRQKRSRYNQAVYEYARRTKRPGYAVEEPINAIG